MEQPTSPIGLPPNKEPIQQKNKLPTPEELISHYQSKGLEPNEASMKVIEDLQNVLVRVVKSGRGKKDKFMLESSRKLDSANTRLAILELKMDSKPGYVEALVIGVVAGGITKGAGNVLPHVIGAFGQIWEAVKSFTKT